MSADIVERTPLDPAAEMLPAAEGGVALDATPEGGADRPALRRCVSISPTRFAAEIWAERAWLSGADELPAGFGDLFSRAAADEVLSRQGLRTPFLRVAKDGITLPTTHFTTGGGVGAGIADQASDVRLTKLFAEGATIVLQALHRTHPPVIDFAQALGVDLGHPVQVNAYLTPPQSQGFSTHYDVHDVFVLQIAGEKRWRIHAPVLPAPLRDQPWTDHRDAVEAAGREEPLIDAVLRPGDALYLPRGYLHSAVALGQATVHLTVGVHVWTRRHLLEQLLAVAGADEELRATLPLGVDITDPDSIRRELSRTVSAFADRIGRVEPEAVAAGLVGASLNSAKAAPVGPLAQAEAAAGIGLDGRLRWRPALRVVISRDGDHLIVRTPDATVQLPAFAADGLERLRSGAVVSVAELGRAANPEAGLELARTLLRTCLTVPA